MFITEGQERAQRTRSLGKSTPNPHAANMVILKAINKSGYVKVDSNYTAILINIIYFQILQQFHQLMYQEPIFFDSVIQTLAKELDFSIQTITQLAKDPVYDKCLGALYGAFFGDALGSYCEFQKCVSESMIQKAMEMRGGGLHKTYRGQVTDDSEMALHLLKSLLKYDKQKSFQECHETICLQLAVEYVKWVMSRPFDIGNTFNSTILQIYYNDGQLSMQDLQQCLKNGDINGDKMFGTGFLMRSTPMAIFTALMKKYRYEDFNKNDKLIQTEIRMTHRDKQTWQIGTEWVKLLANIILREDQIQSLSYICRSFFKKQRTGQVRKWVLQGKMNNLMYDYYWTGSGQIPFSYGLAYFRKIVDNITEEDELTPELYRQIIANVIKKGGDTGSNACIVGGILGSIFGFKRLPNQYKHYQMNLSLKKGRNLVDRPTFYEPKNGLYFATQLFLKFMGKKTKKQEQQERQRKEKQQKQVKEEKQEKQEQQQIRLEKRND